MGVIVIGILIAVVVVFGGKLARAVGGVNTRPARGILLSVASTRSSSFGSGSTRVEYRQMKIDVEVPGEAPYEVKGNFMYPANLARDMVPGAQVELRVGKRNKFDVSIVGPGVGFAAAQLNAPTTGGQS